MIDGGAGWTAEVIAFLSKNLPVDRDVGRSVVGWDHMFLTAYQIGCEALVALGYAEETSRGAIPRTSPKLPDPLPRWDDICVAVLKLAEQQGQLDYRLSDGNVPRPRNKEAWTILRPPSPPPPAPNVASSYGLGPAYGAAETVSVLERLGLVADGRWSSDAETVLWRDQPRAWEMQVTADPRFIDAVSRACTTLPDDIRAEMDHLATIHDAELEETLERSAKWLAEGRAKYGPNAKLVSIDTLELARRAIEFGRRNKLDWLFFRRWRLSDGWLTSPAAFQALEIFHDPLGIAMRQAVVGRLYPDVTFFQGR
jgi:hypothetical protein